FESSERALNALDERYKRALHTALHHRPTVLGASAGMVVLAMLILPTLNFELMPQADEGQVTVDIELPVGTRIELTRDVVQRVEQMIHAAVPEQTMIISSAGGGGWWGGGSNRANLEVQLVPSTERERSSEQIATDLRRVLTDLPGAVVRTRASGGNSQMNRILGGVADARLSLEIRGHDIADQRRFIQQARALMENTEGVTDVRLGREAGRPELAVRVDRPKAALLGLSVSGVAETIRTNVAGTQAAFF